MKEINNIEEMKKYFDSKNQIYDFGNEDIEFGFEVKMKDKVMIAKTIRSNFKISCYKICADIIDVNSICAFLGAAGEVKTKEYVYIYQLNLITKEYEERRKDFIKDLKFDLFMENLLQKRNEFNFEIDLTKDTKL